MKILFILSLGLLSSCISSNSLVGVSKNKSSMIQGVITNAYREQGCAFLFEFKDTNGIIQLVRPLDLHDSFKKEGMLVRIKFRMSKEMNNECDLARPVIIDRIMAVEI